MWARKKNRAGHHFLKKFGGRFCLWIAFLGLRFLSLPLAGASAVPLAAFKFLGAREWKKEASSRPCHLQIAPRGTKGEAAKKNPKQCIQKKERLIFSQPLKPKKPGKIFLPFPHFEGEISLFFFIPTSFLWAPGPPTATDVVGRLQSQEQQEQQQQQ